MSEITKLRAFAFNSLVKDGTILEILKAYKGIDNLKDLIENAMDEINETIDKTGRAYMYEDMTAQEIEQMDKFITERITSQYNKLWKYQLKFDKVSQIATQILKQADILVDIKQLPEKGDIVRKVRIKHPQTH